MEDDDKEDCQHIWRPFWTNTYLSHFVCDKCGEYTEDGADDFDD